MSDDAAKINSLRDSFVIIEMDQPSKISTSKNVIQNSMKNPKMIQIHASISEKDKNISIKTLTNSDMFIDNSPFKLNLSEINNEQKICEINEFNTIGELTESIILQQTTNDNSTNDGDSTIVDDQNNKNENHNFYNILKISQSSLLKSNDVKNTNESNDKHLKFDKNNIDDFKKKSFLSKFFQHKKKQKTNCCSVTIKIILFFICIFSLITLEVYFGFVKNSSKSSHILGATGIVITMIFIAFLWYLFHKKNVPENQNKIEEIVSQSPLQLN